MQDNFDLDVIQRINPNPIFVLGITPRSGTNFLASLLGLHPHCRGASVIGEDYLLAHVAPMLAYTNCVWEHWQRNWSLEEIGMHSSDFLCKYLGNGLVSLLNLQLCKPDEGDANSWSHEMRLVTKTPSVKNLQYFFDLFPASHLLIVVRDGRSAVESGVKSSMWDYERGMHLWADAAKKILEFDRANQDTDRKYTIVRYEDLCLGLEEELAKILVFLGLNRDAYDFRAARNLPVRGSSKLCEEGDLHWHPVEKTPDFDPLHRWRDWGRFQHERFNWIAGDSLEAFGYEKKNYSNNRLMWEMLNVLLDARWEVGRTLQDAQRGLRAPGLRL